LLITLRVLQQSIYSVKLSKTDFNYL